jgi:hypothetical protein
VTALRNLKKLRTFGTNSEGESFSHEWIALCLGSGALIEIIWRTE